MNIHVSLFVSFQYIGLTYWTRFDTTYAAQRDEDIRQKYIEIQKAQKIKLEEANAKKAEKNKDMTTNGTVLGDSYNTDDLKSKCFVHTFST